MSTQQEDTLTVFIKELRQYVDAGSSIIHVRSTEYDRTLHALVQSILQDKETAEVWSYAEGFVIPTDASKMIYNKSNSSPDRELGAALRRPYDYLRHIESDCEAGVGTALPPIAAVDKTSNHYLIYTGINEEVFRMPNIQSMFHTLAARLAPTTVRVIIITSPYTMPEAMPESIVTLSMQHPSMHELTDIFRRITEDLVCGGDEAFGELLGVDEMLENAEQFAKLGVGMSKSHFENSSALAIIKAVTELEDNPDDDTLDPHKLIMQGIADGKREAINKSDLLEFIPRVEDMDDVGGMENLKEWFAKRALCYSEEAREAGIEPPKGVVLVGVAGTGKSLIAKAAGYSLGVPVVKLDIGKVFNSLVGASEQRMRQALKLAEDIAPCLLLVDEVDKALGGAGSGGGDSGVSSRVLGTLLTWLQECKAPVFTMVTANSVAHLPPELLRRGRFDATFSCVLPTDDERFEVLAIHLQKRRYDVEDLVAEGSDEHIEFLHVSDGFVPAEIESIVKDALIDAFYAGEELKWSHIKAAFKSTVPMSKSNKAQVDAIIAWAKDNATPVSRVKKAVTAQATGQAAPRRTRSPMRSQRKVN